MRLPTKEDRIREMTSDLEGEVVDDPRRKPQYWAAAKAKRRKREREEAARP